MLWNVAFPALIQLRLWTTYPPRLFNFDETILNVCADSLFGTSLISLRERSSPFPLRYFQLVNAAAHGSQLERFLRRIPTLHILDLRRTYFGWTDTVSSLCKDETFLPSLTCLRIDDYAASSNNRTPDKVYEKRAKQILKLVTERCQPHGKLDTLVFIVRRPSNPIAEWNCSGPMPAGFMRVMSRIMEIYHDMDPSDEVRIYLQPFRLALRSDLLWWNAGFEDDWYTPQDDDSYLDDEDIEDEMDEGIEFDDGDKEDSDEDSGSDDDDSKDDDMLA